MIKISIYKKNREQIKNMIIRTAVDLFREKGYDNVSVDEITAKIEIAKGTFYNYFKSKGDLLIYWSSECFSKVAIKDEINCTKSTVENLSCLLENFARAISEEKELFLIFIREIRTIEPPNDENGRDFDFTRLLRTIISNSCDGTSILSDKPEIKIQVLNSAIFSGIVNWLCSKRDTGGLSGYLIDIMKICLYGILERINDKW